MNGMSFWIWTSEARGNSGDHREDGAGQDGTEEIHMGEKYSPVRIARVQGETPPQFNAVA